MASIRGLGIDAVELPHSPGEVGIGRLDDELIMIAYLAVGVATPVEPAKQSQPIQAVLIVAIDCLAPITASGHMIEPASKLNA
ncbi:hypothetical protein G3446_25580 [Thiorhodococcus minor]|uniref:Uncharacterized protein n=1 Tax=Thiorhodococcus minor TaxID=57489 RepID=A0A6M0K5W6_9GAMM|nr:hypothetical protein [Thiorhodococcus minor]